MLAAIDKNKRLGFMPWYGNPNECYVMWDLAIKFLKEPTCNDPDTAFMYYWYVHTGNIVSEPVVLTKLRKLYNLEFENYWLQLNRARMYHFGIDILAHLAHTDKIQMFLTENGALDCDLLAYTDAGSIRVPSSINQALQAYLRKPSRTTRDLDSLLTTINTNLIEDLSPTKHSDILSTLLVGKLLNEFFNALQLTTTIIGLKTGTVLQLAEILNKLILAPELQARLSDDRRSAGYSFGCRNVAANSTFQLNGQQGLDHEAFGWYRDDRNQLPMPLHSSYLKKYAHLSHLDRFTSLMIFPGIAIPRFLFNPQAPRYVNDIVMFVGLTDSVHISHSSRCEEPVCEPNY